MPKGHERHLAALGLETNAEYRRWCAANGLRTTLCKTWIQRRDEVRLRARQSQISKLETRMERHARVLDFSTFAEYLAWCEAYCFSVSTGKTATQLEAERTFHSEEKARLSLATARLLSDRPDLTLEAIFRGEVTPRILQDERFASVIAALDQKRMKGKTRGKYLELLRCALGQSRMMSDSGAACPHYGVLPSNTFAQGLARVAELYAEWRRPLSDWKCPNTDPLTQFRSLVHYLFSEYKTPPFLISVWFDPDEKSAEAGRLWWLTLAAGGSLRTLSLPIMLTQKERHAFLTAPDTLMASAALRWAQARGRGATVAAAKAMLNSRLREVLPDESFWDTVVRFFVDHRASPAQIPLIVDFLYSRKLAHEVMQEGNTSRPEFSIKGRTLVSLLRLTERWHADRMRFALSTVQEWTPLPCPPLEIGQSVLSSDTEPEDETKTQRWRVQEILNTRELHSEGAAQRNCVASYHNDCLSGKSAILSVRRWIEAKNTFQRVLTVEVHPATRKVVQIRAKCNRLPHLHPQNPTLQTGLEILTLWAEQNGMAIEAGA